MAGEACRGSVSGPRSPAPRSCLMPEDSGGGRDEDGVRIVRIDHDLLGNGPWAPSSPARRAGGEWVRQAEGQKRVGQTRRRAWISLLRKRLVSSPCTEEIAEAWSSIPLDGPQPDLSQ